MATSLDVFSELLRRLYAGVIETPPWEAFLEGVRHETACKAALIMLAPPSSPAVNLLSVVGGQPEISDAYRERLFALEPMLNLPEGEVMSLHEFVGPQAIEDNAYYNDFMRPWGIGFVLGADIQTEAGYSARLRLCRATDADDFDATVRELLESLLPHLRQAVELFDHVHRLQVEEIERSDALDRLGIATFLLDATGRVARPNRSALELFASAAGLVVRHGRLRLASGEAQSRLERILEATRNPGVAQTGGRKQLPEVITIARASGVSGAAVAVRRLHSPADLRADHAPVVAVYVSQLEPGAAIPAELIRELLGVTRAEAELAARLTGGATLDEAAADLAITRATVRTQLYSIFRKTGLHRQSELIALISQTSARLPQG